MNPWGLRQKQFWSAPVYWPSPAQAAMTGTWSDDLSTPRSDGLWPSVNPARVGEAALFFARPGAMRVEESTTQRTPTQPWGLIPISANL